MRNMTWFDVLKLNPLEQQRRMQERAQGGTAQPQQPEQTACARCGSTNFMRGDLDPEGKGICALCKKRFYEEATA